MKDDFAALQHHFLAARELAADRQRAYLARLACERPELSAEVDALLAADGQDDSFFDLVGQDRFGELVQELQPPTAHTPQPEQVGDYRILRRLGGGGSAAVHVAEQERPIRRRVALKVMRPGAGGLDGERRFLAERQTLASLNHPNIAAVYDAGTLPDGRPYVAMELVDGQPITQYCRAAQLTLPERIALFGQVCQAVAYAHGRGVIHRDLKPPNVLVTSSGGQPLAKVIDFGIAKLTASDLPDAQVHTAHGEVLGTRGYMSPEQMMGRTAEVDVRADVYALGVLLFEMVTGQLPHDLGGRTVDEALERMRDPVSLPTEVAPRRTRRDLAAVIGQCLQFVPDRRYRTVAELESDIARLQRGDPVTARPPGARRHLAHFVRRHRALSTATGVCLLTFGVAFLWVVHYGREAEVKNQQLAEVMQVIVKDTVTRLDELAGTAQVRRSTLETALQTIAMLLEDDPGNAELRELRAEALSRLGRVALHEQAIDEAFTLQREALAVLKVLVAEYPEVAEYRADLSIATVRLGDLYGDRGQRLERREHYLRALAIDEALAAEHPDVRRYLDNLVWSYDRVAAQCVNFGEYRRAEALRRQQLELALELVERWPAELLSHYAALTAHVKLSAPIWRAPGRAELRHAQAAHEFAVYLTQADPHSRNYDLAHAWAVGRLADLYDRLGDPAQSRVFQAQAIDLLTRMFEQDPQDRHVVTDLAKELIRGARRATHAGDRPGGRALLEQARQYAERVPGDPAHRDNFTLWHRWHEAAIELATDDGERLQHAQALQDLLLQAARRFPDELDLQRKLLVRLAAPLHPGVTGRADALAAIRPQIWDTGREHRPELLVELGRAELQLGECCAAAETLRVALEHLAPDSPRRERAVRIASSAAEQCGTRETGRE